MPVLFAVTLFLSATLLFLVQLIVGKMILPKFGGTPAVWNTCMVFFQAGLLAGYGYVHAIQKRLSVRKQAILQVTMLSLTTVVLLLPVIFTLGDKPPVSILHDPPGGGNPVFWLLYLLLVSVGLPFFMISTSAPLLQKWFAATGHPSSNDPYFLYAASNVGSMLVLFAYPAALEPILRLPNQSWFWFVGFVMLVGLTTACAAQVWKEPAVKPKKNKKKKDKARQKEADEEKELAPALEKEEAEDKESFAAESGSEGQPASTAIAEKAAPPAPPVNDSSPNGEHDVIEPGEDADAPTFWRKVKWVTLAFIPSSLMLGVTTYMSTDIAPIPLIWVIPLALYLLSFIFVFARMPEWVHQLMVLILPVVVLLQVFMTLADFNDPLWMAIMVHLATLFLAAMVCHGELARDRPSTRHLTEFYLLMSLGGVLGGMFNALAAPLLFNTIIEYPLMLVIACLMLPQLEEVKQDRRNRVLDFVLPVLLGAVTFVFVWQLSTPRGAQFIRDVQEFLAEGIGKATPGRDKLGKLMMYGIPALVCYGFVTRSLRFGLGVGALILAAGLYNVYEPGGISENEILLRHRSFFGVLKLEDQKHEFRYGLAEEHISELREAKVPDEVLDKIEDIVGRAQPESRFFANIQTRLTPEEYEKYAPIIRNTAYKYRWANTRRLVHGTTLHGTMCIDDPDPYKLAAFLAPAGAGNDFQAGVLDYLATPIWSDPRPRPQTYYARMGPVGLLFQEFSGPKAKPAVALIGLGSGTLSVYGQKGQKVTFYEIDQAVVDIAKKHFNYLKTCQADWNIELGDARIAMKDTAKDGAYGIIAVDAFSSDAIPVHLITKEALELYMQKLSPDGIVAFHISNRYLDLQPVLANLAKAVDPPLVGIVRHGSDDERFEPPVPNYGMSASTWVLLSRNRENFGTLTKDPEWYDLSKREDKKVGVWTDDFSNILSVFNWGH